MSKLDDIKPSRPDGQYSCELLVEGQWVTLALADRETIERAADVLAGFDEVEQLIRTEKLKLLVEVREQTTIFKIKAHDKKGQPHLYEAGRGVPTDVLTKLEAEL